MVRTGKLFSHSGKYPLVLSLPVRQFSQRVTYAIVIEYLGAFAVELRTVALNLLGNFEDSARIERISHHCSSPGQHMTD